MLAPIDSGRTSAALTPAASDPPRTPAEWAKEALSWASPGGVIMHAVQPLLGQAMRSSGVGAGTEWGFSLQRVLDDPKSVASFQEGFAKGLFNGGKSLVEGAWGLTKGVLEASYNTNPVGWAVEGLQHLGVVGDVPDWVPDAGRVTEKATAVGEGIAKYLGEVAHDPAKLGNDVKGWIAANWDSLKDSHAAAAAKGGSAESEWWGQIAGRATFEVAAVAVPVTKFATVAKAGEALELAIKGGKVAETFADAARGGKLIELTAAAAKSGNSAALVAEARTAGRLPELVSAAKSSTGGLQALVGRGGLTVDEIGALEKAGTLSKAEAHVARVAEVSVSRSADIAATAQRTGLSPSKIADILATEKPGRPLPASYIADARMAREVAKYDEGAVRFLSRDAYNTRGTLGPPGGFVMPYKEFEGLVRAANGDMAVVEQKLGLSAGYLRDADTMIVKIDKADFHDLKLPSGNERGANEFWVPGGVTSGGVSEATLDFPKGTPFQEIHLSRTAK